MVFSEGAEQGAEGQVYNVRLTLSLVKNSPTIYIAPESQTLVCALNSDTFRFMRDQIKEGSKGT